MLAPKPHSVSPPKLPRTRRLRRADLPADTVTLARFLIGTYLVAPAGSARLVARIVETEAYLPGGDPASHAFRGRTARNGAMFSERGFAYVYFIYGNHYCLNVTSEAAGIGAAVLIRAAEPLAGLDVMRARRGSVVARDLLRGPGRLAQAFAVDAAFDGVDLCKAGPLWLARDNRRGGEAIVAGPRIGITKNAGAPLRFYEAGNLYVSGPKTTRAPA